MCKQCRVNVCGNCTWKAQRIVAFHAPLPCQHRVLVESCVARVESAMQDLERKHAAANASARRGGRSVRPGRGDQDKDSQVGTESSQKGTDSIKELPKSMPTLSEMIEVLMQLGRTAEVKTLREIEAGSYEAPVKGVEELTSAQLISSSSKPCPTGCGWDITKDKGCNHMTCKKCGHKFCWRCLQARPRESDAHDCQGAPDVASFDPKVQNLIRRVLQSYDPSVETRPVVSNPLVADAAAIVSFASSYLFCPTHTGSKDAAGGVGSGGKDLLEEDVTIEEASGRKVISHSEPHQGTGADGKKCSVSPEEKEIEAVQKLLARLRKLWEGRSDMFEALAQEQHTETGAEGDARDGIPMLHRRLQRRREEMQAMMMERLEGDEFDAVDWRLRTHRRMQRRENIEVEIQRQARVRDEQQRLLLRRLLLEEISSTLGGGSGSAAGHGPHDASEGVSGTESLTAEEVEAKVERCAEVYAEYNHLHLELQRVLQVRQAVVDYEAPSAAARAGARPFEIERARGGGVMFDARERIARERIAFLENMRQRHAMLYAHRVEQRATGAAVAMPSSLRAWEPSQDADLLNRYLVRAEPVGSGAGGAGAGSNSSNSRVDGLSGDSALPRHWHQDADSEGRTYYWNRHLGLSQWARPVAPTELTPSAYAATAAPTSSLAAIAQARVAGDGVNTTPTVAPQQDAWQQLSLLVDQRRQRMMALSGAGTHGLEERDELDDSMRAASRSMAARAIQQRESLLSAAAGTGGIGGATAPEQMPVSREPAEQGAGDRIQFVPLRRPHRAEVGGLAPMEGAPGDDSTFSEMLLSVLEFHICSLSWNVSCKLFALGQLLGQLPHALPSPQPLVRLVDLLTAKQAKQAKHTSAAEHVTAVASTDLLRILCPAPRAMTSMLVDEIFREPRLRSAALLLLPTLVADEQVKKVLQTCKPTDATAILITHHLYEFLQNIPVGNPMPSITKRKLKEAVAPHFDDWGKVYQEYKKFFKVEAVRLLGHVLAKEKDKGTKCAGKEEEKQSTEIAKDVATIFGAAMDVEAEDAAVAADLVMMPPAALAADTGGARGGKRKAREGAQQNTDAASLSVAVRRRGKRTRN